MHSSTARYRSTSRPASPHVPRTWDPEQEPDDENVDAFLSASDLAKTLQPVPRRPASQTRRHMSGREPSNLRRTWPGITDMPLEPTALEMYQAEVDTVPTLAAAAAARRREYGTPHPPRQRFQQQGTRRPQSAGPMDNEILNNRRDLQADMVHKRERNRAAVKKCRQRQALKLEYLQHKAETLTAENLALSEMLVKNTELDGEQRTSLTRGIQMDILLKIKEIFTQSLPKDFVLDADSIWDLNSVLAVSMPSRCYYGIDSIKDFWRTSLRMRNKGKIRSFWAWLFRLPPGDRFSEFDIQPFSPKSNLYFISWTTKSTPPLAGSMVIMFGNGHRVTLHVECFGWLIWRYLLSNEPFPEPSMD
ncbi:hypothetical protein JM18_003703 [Phytophthora kernoviae]|uniref:BZIP domain-containing protein n=1 Tax=Phytophthora kernoviae TaxID=325452 RepID=A0A921VB22_9STRA|nr:hypothetical protein JM18_003703 [Phytophthora kernoviae]